MVTGLKEEILTKFPNTQILGSALTYSNRSMTKPDMSYTGKVITMMSVISDKSTSNEFGKEAFDKIKRCKPTSLDSYNHYEKRLCIFFWQQTAVWKCERFLTWNVYT